MARKRRVYTDKFRASAVVMLEATEYPEREGGLAQVAKHLNMPPSTLAGWYKAHHNPPPTELRDEKKGDLVALLADEIEAALRQMPNVRNDTPYKELALSIGIMIDKKQILDGRPNEIQEVNVKDTRERTLARLAGDAGGYVAPAKNGVGQLPN